MKIGYDKPICHDCAMKHGGKIPEVSVVTKWLDECHVCKKKKGVCSTGDYLWEDGKIRGVWD